jgi:hypothetical protein
LTLAIEAILDIGDIRGLGEFPPGGYRRGFAPPETETEGVALVSPSGWRIEGLTVTQAVEAARRLG